MDVISDIMDALGGQAAIAKATGIPPQTVSDWKRNGIPPWRRTTLVDLPVAEGKSLSPKAIAYLHSVERKPEGPSPTSESAAA